MAELGTTNSADQYRRGSRQIQYGQRITSEKGRSVLSPLFTRLRYVMALFSLFIRLIFH